MATENAAKIVAVYVQNEKEYTVSFNGATVEVQANYIVLRDGFLNDKSIKIDCIKSLKIDGEEVKDLTAAGIAAALAGEEASSEEPSDEEVKAAEAALAEAKAGLKTAQEEADGTAEKLAAINAAMDAVDLAEIKLNSAVAAFVAAGGKYPTPVDTDAKPVDEYQGGAIPAPEKESSGS